MRLKDDQSISTCPRQPYARLRMSGATIQTKPGAKADVQKLQLSFAGPYNKRVRLTLLPTYGRAVEMELSRSGVRRLAAWLYYETTEDVPGDWPDSVLKRLVAKEPDCLPQAYRKASSALQAQWRKRYPKFKIAGMPQHGTRLM